MSEEDKGFTEVIRKIARRAGEKAREETFKLGLRIMILHEGYLCWEYPSGRIIKIKRNKK